MIVFESLSMHNRNTLAARISTRYNYAANFATEKKQALINVVECNIKQFEKMSKTLKLKTVLCKYPVKYTKSCEVWGFKSDTIYLKTEKSYKKTA